MYIRIRGDKIWTCVAFGIITGMVLSLGVVVNKRCSTDFEE